MAAIAPTIANIERWLLLYDKQHFQMGSEMLLPGALSTLDLDVMLGYDDLQ